MKNVSHNVSSLRFPENSSASGDSHSCGQRRISVPYNEYCGIFSFSPPFMADRWA